MNDRTDDLILVNGDLPYSELDYIVFCKHYDDPKALLAYFGQTKVAHMERRFDAEHCFLCKAEVDEEEQNAADEDSRHPQCEDCARELRLDRCYRRTA